MLFGLKLFLPCVLTGQNMAAIKFFLLREFSSIYIKRLGQNLALCHQNFLTSRNICTSLKANFPTNTGRTCQASLASKKLVRQFLPFEITYFSPLRRTFQRDPFT